MEDNNISDKILKYMKVAEHTDLVGLQKKEFVLEMIKKQLPDLYTDHKFMIDIMIDSIIVILNNPSIIKVKKNFFKNCCS